jgi:hypothetical protein
MDGLFIPSRQLSFIVAGLLFLSFFIFMTGYFLGKKNVVEQFSEQVQQEAFADQVYTSVLASANIEENEQAEQAINQTLLVAEADTMIASDATEIAHDVIKQDIITQELSSSAQYYAQLIGFGTEKAAQLFVKKLSDKGIETEVKKRTSKTAKGRTSYWYQVVTVAHQNKDDLLALVDKIAKEENIKGAQIRTC